MRALCTVLAAVFQGRGKERERLSQKLGNIIFKCFGTLEIFRNSHSRNDRSLSSYFVRAVDVWDLSSALTFWRRRRRTDSRARKQSGWEAGFHQVYEKPFKLVRAFASDCAEKRLPSTYYESAEARVFVPRREVRMPIWKELLRVRLSSVRPSMYSFLDSSKSISLGTVDR